MVLSWKTFLLQVLKKLDCGSIQGTCQVNDADGNTNCEVRVEGQQGTLRGMALTHRMQRIILESVKKAPKIRSCELYKPRNGVKSFYQNRKRIYTQERYLQAPIKKRKLFNHRSTVAHDQQASSNSISNSPEKGICMDKSNSVTGASTTVKGHKKGKDPHVKFNIKSFKVPELYIEVPETASVGSLKRTVMEAITAILGNGVRVGVVLQGTKVRDDNRTLQQAGISQNSDLDTLGFSLEPTFTNICSSMTPKKLSSILPCDANEELMSDFISAPQTPKNETVNGTVPDSKALVPVSPTNSVSLAVAPANLKPRKNELSQHRTRKPFSVGGFEAYVEAVERQGGVMSKWVLSSMQIIAQTRRAGASGSVGSAHSYWSRRQGKQPGVAEPLSTVDPKKETM
ncbi:telomere repeat-binding protein 4-like [Salvia divinorum]|uniref:Telomere repeat-binding protein 4-like n=1 Tax=Salvia divinorum TaxID=28513 RepID=A0ABD1GDI5_SALDI